MSLPIFIVDAFASGPFTGNPAAVCLLDGDRPADWMQNVAMEMNLSETAFVARQDGGKFGLRWFTPRVEVDLCGHATLASAHVLWETGALGGGAAAEFQTRSGTLICRRDGQWISMDFPAKPATDAAAPQQLWQALGIGPARCLRNQFDYLVELDESTLRKLSPDFGLLAKAPVRGVIVTARCEDGSCDFLSRFFAPAVGVNEDPVTGSAHCCLGPYWAAKLGKADLLGRQISTRGGVVRTSVRGDRVILGGQAVTVVQGSLPAE